MTRKKNGADTPLSFLIAAFVASSMLVACARASQIEGAGRISDPRLRDVVVAYYRAEARQDWKATYGYRSDAFRRLVRFEKYAHDMQAADTGWRLEHVEILSAERVDDECRLRIRFTEGVSKAAAEKTGLGAVSKQVDVESTTWRSTNEKWYVLDAGTRNHLSLNANIADN
jgi:hypothetical protein